MLLKLIKTRSFISGSHCEVWEINHLTGNRLLGEVFVLNEHLPLELIYRLTVTKSGICFAGRHCGWMWQSERLEIAVTEYLKVVQECREEIRIEVCEPEPNLPGYPEVDYNPDDYPIVFCELLRKWQEMKIFLPFLREFGKIVRFAVYIVIRVGKSSATSAQPLLRDRHSMSGQLTKYY